MYVRNHAVRRYSERVLGLTFGGTFDHAMARVEDSSGLTVADIRNLIIDDVSPRLPATVLYRGTRRVVKGLDAKYVINRNMVHTCYRGNEIREWDDD